MAFNPAPLGLFGFASATILLNLHNMGLYGLTVVVVGMGIALGGLAQLCAGVFEMIHKNIFGGLAFFSYGGFWWSLVLIWLLPGCTDIAKPNEGEMALYLCVWGIFTTGMFFGTLKGPIIGSVVFFSLAVLFYALGIRDCLYGILGTEHFLSKTVGALSGIWGVWTGLTAFVCYFFYISLPSMRPSPLSTRTSTAARSCLLASVTFSPPRPPRLLRPPRSPRWTPRASLPRSLSVTTTWSRSTATFRARTWFR